MDQATDIYATAATELASIDDQIAALEKRRIALRQFVELGRKLYGSPSANSRPTLADVNTKPQISLALVARENSKKARILALCQEAIQERGAMHTRDLVTYIEDHGVELTAADKYTSVSVMLSRSADFRSDRVHGWTLVKKNPQNVAPSAGSSTA